MPAYPDLKALAFGAATMNPLGAFAAGGLSPNNLLFTAGEAVRNLSRPPGRSRAQNNPYPLGPAYGGDQQNLPQGRGRVGGGNAGASVQPPRRTPVVQPASNTTAVVLPGSRNVTIVNGPERARNSAVSAAAQQAGLPAWNWQADENRSVRQAAMSAGEAAAAARSAGQPLASEANANRQEYWQPGGRGSLADMQAWAAANPALAARLRQRSGYGTTGVAPTLNSSDDAILAAQGAGALDGLRSGSTTDDALLAGQAAGVFDGRSAPMQLLDGDQAILRAQASGSLDGLRPGATADDAMLSGQMAGVFDQAALDPTTRVASAQAAAPTTNALPQSQDLAQENLRQYLEAIKRGGMNLG
jgi:hypothetical protein